VEAWGFIWLMILLKIPVAALLWLVWWAIHATPEPNVPVEGDDDGGLGDRSPHGPRPLSPPPRRRGPHREAPPPAPARMRTARPTPARAREQPQR
jgi:hypothetical protein